MTPKPALLLKISVCLLLASCNSVSPLKLGEEPGEYRAPLSREEWAYTAFGFYLSRSTEFDDNKITYTALYDNRRNRKNYLDYYQTTENFRRTYPAYVRHTGSTDCGGNTATIEQLDENMSVIYKEPAKAMTEVSINLCTLQGLAKSTDD